MFVGSLGSKLVALVVQRVSGISHVQGNALTPVLFRQTLSLFVLLTLTKSIVVMGEQSAYKVFYLCHYKKFIYGIVNRKNKFIHI